MLNKIEVTALGRPWLLRFDMYAMELLYDENGVSFPGKLGFVSKMLYAGLSSACDAAGKENDFTRETVLDIVDELTATGAGREVLNKVSDCLVQSQAYRGIMEMATDIESEEKKSLSNGIKPAPSLLVN